MKMDVAAGSAPRLSGLQEPTGYVDGANLYQFVGSNPIDLADPSGLRLYRNTDGFSLPNLPHDPFETGFKSVDPADNTNDYWIENSSKDSGSGTPILKLDVANVVSARTGEVYNPGANIWVITEGMKSQGAPTAARLFAHYMGQTGASITLEGKEMFHDSAQMRSNAYDDLNDAMAYAESVKNEHSFFIQTTRWQSRQVTDSPNWYWSFRGYATAGTAQVWHRPGSNNYTMDYHYEIYKRYNFDATKTYRFGVGGKDLQALNNIGLARNFDVFAHLTFTISWCKGQRINTPTGHIE